MELLEFEAYFYSEETFCTLPLTILQCVHSNSASLSHRLSAATLALIQADNHADHAAAELVYEAISKLDPTTELQRIHFLTCAAVFHTAFGEPDRVPQLLSELVELGRRIQRPVPRAAVLRRAAWGLCRFGERSFAREVLGEAMEIFDRLRLSGQLAHCLELSCEIDLQVADYTAALRTLRRIQELGVESPGFYLSAVEYEVRVRLAIETGSREYLNEFLAPSEALTPFQRAPRTHLNVSALQLGDHLLRGSDADVRRLLSIVERLYPVLKNRCDQDFVNVVLGTALARTGRGPDAVHTLREYLGEARRESNYLLPSLDRLASELRVPIPERLRSPNGNWLAPLTGAALLS